MITQFSLTILDGLIEQEEHDAINVLSVSFVDITGRLNYVQHIFIEVLYGSYVAMKIGL